jgi:hypothetical protein
VLAGVHEHVSSLPHTIGIENLLELERKILFRADSLSEEYDNNSVPLW